MGWLLPDYSVAVLVKRQNHQVTQAFCESTGTVRGKPTEKKECRGEREEPLPRSTSTAGTSEAKRDRTVSTERGRKSVTMS